MKLTENEKDTIFKKSQEKRIIFLEGEYVELTNKLINKNTEYHLLDIDFDELKRENLKLKKIIDFKTNKILALESEIEKLENENEKLFNKFLNLRGEKAILAERIKSALIVLKI